MNRYKWVALFALALSGCASWGALQQVVQPPQFSAASEQPSSLQLIAPSSRYPLGGAQIRLWAQVSNPNPFGLVLSALQGRLELEDTEAAEVDLPLGLPLPASRDTVIPLDITVSFSSLPTLAEVLPRAVTRGAVDYRFHGSFSVDAGLLGQPRFGPATLLSGRLRTGR